MKRVHKILCYALIALLSGCSPIIKFTMVKRVPRKYSINYDYPNVRAEKTELNKKAWIVYSDRSGNVTTVKAGGILPHTELKFMEPLFVVAKKGDYYKLVKYDAEILQANERFAEKKSAQYCGWLHKDRLLLYNNSLTGIRNRVLLKSLTAITESRNILNASNFFNNDSIFLYTNPVLRDRSENLIGLHTVTSVLKYTENGSSALVTCSSKLQPDDIESLTVGWIDASLIIPFGQRLVFMEKSVTENNYFNLSYLQDSVKTPVNPPVFVNPVLYADRQYDNLTFRTLDAGQIIDYSGNTIFNVNGIPISYDQSKIIKSQLQEINIIFTFNLTENVLDRLPMLSNTILNMSSIFKNSPIMFNFRYAAVLDDKIVSFNNNYISFCEQLIKVCDEIAENGTNNRAEALSYAVSLAGQKPNATNLIVFIGERADSETASKSIINSFVENNCRLLSFQVFDGNNNVYNNFVLQNTDIIEQYADAAKISKRKIIVNADQLRIENRFIENLKNNYSLDFPLNSMTQGMIIFPEKEQYTDTELLINGLNTFVRQIEDDNSNLIFSIDKAFIHSGNYRSRFDRSFATRFDIETEMTSRSDLNEAFFDISPQWVHITERINIPIDSLNLPNFALLLNESELAAINDFIDKISAKQLEMKGSTSSTGDKNRAVRRVRKELRKESPEYQVNITNINPHDLFTEREYANTKPVRKYLKKTYINALKQCVLNGKLRHTTLAEAHEYITTAPTITPVLNTVRIKDLRNHFFFPDEQLDAMIHSFNESKTLIKKLMFKADVISNTQGDKFFILPAEALP